MAEYGWRGDRTLEEWLFEAPYAFDFYQAVRLLELRAAADPDHQPSFMGPARFRASFALSRALSEIVTIADGNPPEMTVSFFGLGGIDGPLPTSFTEDILARLGRHDSAVAAFLDIFHHRLISLLYRIHKTHRPGLATDEPARTALARYLFSLMGLGLPALAGQITDPSGLLRYTGLLGQQPHSAAGLAALLTDYLQVPVVVEQFVGGWWSIEADQWTLIGRPGQNNTLGQTAVIGTRVWFQDAGIRLIVGPLDAEKFARFLPDGPDHKLLAELAQLYVGPDLQIGLQLIIEPDERSKAGLGSTRVGWTSWLRTRPAIAPDAQVHVRLRGLTPGEREAQ